MTNSYWLLKRKIFYRSDVVDESMECEVFCFKLRHLVRNLVENMFCGLRRTPVCNFVQGIQILD